MLSSKKAFSLIELSIVILIIGILIAGVTQGSRLVSEMRIASARALTQSSPIHSIYGISAWWEATNLDAIDVSDPEDGQVVSTWKDQNPQSITKNNVGQSTFGAKPTYRTNRINNLPAISFDGGDYLNIASVSSDNFFPDPQQATAFFVFNSPSNTLHQIFIDFEQTGAPTNRFSVMINPSNLSPNSGIRFDYAYNATDFVAPTNVSNKPTIVTVHRRNSDQTIYVNGVSDSYRSSAPAITPFTSEFGIGRYRTGILYFNGSIGEIIIFNRGLKNEERQAVERYLGKKWGIKIP